MKASYCAEKKRKSNPRHTIQGYMLGTVSKSFRISNFLYLQFNFSLIGIHFNNILINGFAESEIGYETSTTSQPAAKGNNVKKE